MPSDRKSEIPNEFQAAGDARSQESNTTGSGADSSFRKAASKAQNDISTDHAYQKKPKASKSKVSELPAAESGVPDAFSFWRGVCKPQDAADVAGPSGRAVYDVSFFRQQVFEAQQEIYMQGSRKKKPKAANSKESELRAADAAGPSGTAHSDASSFRQKVPKRQDEMPTQGSRKKKPKAADSKESELRAADAAGPSGTAHSDASFRQKVHERQDKIPTQDSRKKKPKVADSKECELRAADAAGPSGTAHSDGSSFRQQISAEQNLPLPPRWTKPKEVLDTNKLLYSKAERMEMRHFAHREKQLQIQQKKLAEQLSRCTEKVNEAKARLAEWETRAARGKRELESLDKLEKDLQASMQYRP